MTAVNALSFLKLTSDPMIALKVKDTATVTKEEQKYLLRLTFTYGMMREWYYADHKENMGKVFIARDSNRIVGWAMLHPKRGQVGEQNAAFYVHKKYRQQGIGKRLMKLLKTTNTRFNMHDQILVMPHDKASHALMDRHLKNNSVKYGM